MKPYRQIQTLFISRDLATNPSAALQENRNWLEQLISRNGTLLVIPWLTYEWVLKDPLGRCRSLVNASTDTKFAIITNHNLCVNSNR